MVDKVSLEKVVVLADEVKRVFVNLKPSITRVSDVWCVSHLVNNEIGVAGHGVSVFGAIQAWYDKLDL